MELRYQTFWTSVRLSKLNLGACEVPKFQSFVFQRRRPFSSKRLHLLLERWQDRFFVGRSCDGTWGIDLIWGNYKLIPMSCTWERSFFGSIVAICSKETPEKLPSTKGRQICPRFTCRFDEPIRQISWERKYDKQIQTNWPEHSILIIVWVQQSQLDKATCFPRESKRISRSHAI